jgi:hypothetical protein
MSNPYWAGFVKPSASNGEELRYGEIRCHPPPVFNVPPVRVRKPRHQGKPPRREQPLYSCEFCKAVKVVTPETTGANLAGTKFIQKVCTIEE